MFTFIWNTSPVMRMSTMRAVFCFLLAGLSLTSRPVFGQTQPAARTVQTVSTLPATPLPPLTGKVDYHVTGTGNPLADGTINLGSPDAWLFLDNVPPSQAAPLLANVRINGAAAADTNARVVQYNAGSVVIPQAAPTVPMTVYGYQAFGGPGLPVQPYVKYGDPALTPIRTPIRSFRLKRGYMATLAQQPNGTGVSKNFVAQDDDLDIPVMPSGLDANVRFIRVFPWRWVSKKGIAGNIWPPFKLGWYYNWNLDKTSSADLEYVPIRQNRYWPPLDQDWKTRGATQLLGYNEPDHKDQSNLTVDEAIAAWPDLLATGLRVGSPGVSDGGLKWLYEFMQKADAANLRVDFVAVHYYRAHSNPADAKGATDQLYRFLKEIHDRTQRPIWLTEFNNGANWTKQPKPSYEQERATIASFAEMLERTPFVERYAIYNWVEDVRNVQRKDGTLTPAGEAYRDQPSGLSYQQPSREVSPAPSKPKS